MVTNRIATSKAVTVVLIGWFTIAGLLGQSTIEEQARKRVEAEKRRTALVENLVVRIVHFSGGTNCQFVGNVEEVGGLTWHNLELSITLSAATDSVEIPIRIETVNANQSSEFKATCQDKKWPKFTPTSMTVKVIEGSQTTTESVTAALPGESYVSKMSASYAKLPLLNTGSSVAFLASDQTCAQQFQEVLSMQGIEKGKRIEDLVHYHCGLMINAPVRLNALSVDAVESIANDATFIKVTVADCLASLRYCPVGNQKANGQSGWVPVKWVSNF